MRIPSENSLKGVAREIVSITYKAPPYHLHLMTFQQTRLLPTTYT